MILCGLILVFDWRGVGVLYIGSFLGRVCEMGIEEVGGVIWKVVTYWVAEGCKRFFFYLVSVSLLPINISSSYRLSAFLFSFLPSSSYLLHLPFPQLFFRQSRKEKLQKKAALSRTEIVRCFRAMEIIGSGGCGAGTRRYVGAFLLWSVGLRFWLSFWLLKVIALRHPATFTASCLWFPITLQQAAEDEAFFIEWGRSIGGSGLDTGWRGWI